MAVVCAGAKSILDIPKTLEYLETQGVSVVSVGSRNFPAFYAPDSGLKVGIFVWRVYGFLTCVEPHICAESH